MNGEKKIYFATKAFILKDNKFLIMHKSIFKEDLWEFPGGRMEFGETAEETLAREINEETGLTVSPLRLLDTWNYVNEDYQIAGIIYLCKIVGGELRPSDEHDDYRWVEAEHKSIDRMVNAFKERMINWDWEEIVK